jgi:hypothetical protein
MIPSSAGTNRTSTSAVHSNSPKFGNINVPKNETKLPPGQPPGQTVATRSASVPSGTSVLKHQQRSLPAPPDEAKDNKDTFAEDNNSGDRSRIPPSFYPNRGEYLKLS